MSEITNPVARTIMPFVLPAYRWKSPMTITYWKYWKSKWEDERIHSKALEEMVRRAKEERDAWCYQSELQCRANAAIRAETIEECAKIAHHYNSDAARDIRALAKTDEEKERI